MIKNLISLQYILIPILFSIIILTASAQLSYSQEATPLLYPISNTPIDFQDRDEYSYYEYYVDKDAIHDKLENNESISVILAGTNYELTLSPFDGDYSGAEYIGTVNDLPNSTVRIEYNPDSPYLTATIILNSEDKFIIENLYRYQIADPTQFVGHNVKDVLYFDYFKNTLHEIYNYLIIVIPIVIIGIVVYYKIKNKKVSV